MSLIRKKFVTVLVIAWMAGSMLSAPAFAAYNFGRDPGAENETPKELADVGISEHLGEKINLDLKFRNEAGEMAPLRDYMRDGKPMLLSLAYYACPSLCNFHLNGLNDAFKQMKEPLGQDFKFVVVSIEPKETADLAARKKASYLKVYNRPEGNAGWHFLTGEQPQISELAKEVGFKYHWDAKENQYAHASAAYVITPDGTISRYFYGIVFNPKDLRLSMVEASNGKVGTVVDKLVLYCFHFDPKASKYTIAAFNIMRAGGVMIILILAAFLIPFWFKQNSNPHGPDDGLQGEA